MKRDLPHRIAKLYTVIMEQPQELRLECERVVAEVEAMGEEATWRQRGEWDDARLALPHLVRLERLIASIAPDLLKHVWGAVHIIGPGITERERGELPSAIGDTLSPNENG